MRRRLLLTALAAPLVWVALATMPALAGASGVPAESHAVRMPAPGPSTTPGTFSSHLAPVRQAWTSENWSGYLIIAAGYHTVSGTWTVPTVIAPTSHKRKNAFSGTWVGIDGYSGTADPNLIQAGTEQDWFHGKAVYQAWWEILPAAETPIPMSIRPGNSITVTITKGTPKWTITLTDNTTHRSFTTQQAYGGPGKSVEWIHEAVTVNGRIARLPHDSTFAFDRSTANGVNPHFVAADSGSIVTSSGVRVSTPSAPDSDRDGFAVAYGYVAPRAPAS